MIVLLKNRLKEFYHPVNLKENNKNLLDNLIFSGISTNHIRIINHSPYDISLARLEEKNAVSKEKMPMIAPFTYTDVPLRAPASGGSKGITIGLINDYGAMETHEHPVQ